MRTKSLVAALAVSTLTIFPASAQSRSSLDTTTYLLMNQYGLAMVHAENCNLDERFLYEFIVMKAVAASPGIDPDTFRRTMAQHLMLERGRSSTNCDLEAQATYKRLMYMYADILVAEANE